MMFFIWCLKKLQKTSDEYSSLTDNTAQVIQQGQHATSGSKIDIHLEQRLLIILYVIHDKMKDLIEVALFLL